MLLALGLSGCEILWNRVSGGGLRRDLIELFRKHGVGGADPVCRMIGTTRAGTAFMRLSGDQVQALVRALDLQEPVVESERFTRLDFLERGDPGGCRSVTAFGDRARTRVYISDRRPPQLAVGNGSTFEYMVLYHRLDTGEACAQVSYAYG